MLIAKFAKGYRLNCAHIWYNYCKYTPYRLTSALRSVCNFMGWAIIVYAFVKLHLDCNLHHVILQYDFIQSRRKIIRN